MIQGIFLSGSVVLAAACSCIPLDTFLCAKSINPSLKKSPKLVLFLFKINCQLDIVESDLTKTLHNADRDEGINKTYQLSL